MLEQEEWENIRRMIEKADTNEFKKIITVTLEIWEKRCSLPRGKVEYLEEKLSELK